MEWTKSAKEELEKYLEHIRSNAQLSGADPIEVTEDIKRHIDEELSAMKLDVVTADDLKHVLSKMGLPEDGPQDRAEKLLEIGALIRKSMGTLFDSLIVIFGIILPAATLGIELVTHMCGQSFFDPIPTFGHVILVGFVPLANLLVWGALKKENFTRMKTLGFLNAIALGVSFFFTLLFLPILPLSAIAVIYMGFGLLPMAPLLSFLTAIALRKKLRTVNQALGHPKVYGLWRGVAIGMGILFLIELPSALTRAGLELAKSESSQKSLMGVKVLRSIGNQESMLRLCYQRPGRATDIISFVFNLHDPVVPDEARTIFYRVYGVPFNSMPAPKLSSRRGGDFDLWDFDEDQGGEAVAGVLKGMELASSRIDTSIDAEGGLAYTEWIFEFKNNSRFQQQEARAQIALPPNGFVSRLTLWINGEEREAAFAGRGKVRQAYQQVVRRQRDPVLVTTSGSNRVLMQCFPVPPNGGTMKVRIGITSPLIIKKPSEGFYRLPYFVERNFKIPKELSHSVWVEAKKPIKSNNGSFVTEQPKKELFALRGSLKDADMPKGENTIRAERSPDLLRAWSIDPANQGTAVKQVLVEKQPVTHGHVVIVVDGSRSMKEISPSIMEALKAVPQNVKPSLLFASNEIPAEKDQIHIVDSANGQKIEELFKASEFIGGQDNIPALLKAWEEASRRENGLIIWVHGPQPIVMKPVEELKQRWERRPDGPRLIEIQGAYGPNKILELLDGVSYVESTPRLGDIKEDLIALFVNSTSPNKTWEFQRDRIGRSGVSALAAKQTSDHLARLWAYDEVLRIIGTSSKTKVDDAIKIAASYHLVTPVSGAVVLENKEQYKQAGLEPVDSSNVPTIPEPEVWAMLIIVALILGWQIYKRKGYFSWQRP
ncbi:MAG: hypothetical protein KCHDKBKB_02908 [Elusimicrobia bacterium]|nr:hypothetical protein [Elusimicrobiota bacterium]